MMDLGDLKHGDILIGINGGHHRCSFRAYMIGQQEKPAFCPMPNPINPHSSIDRTTETSLLADRLNEVRQELCRTFKLTNAELNRSLKFVVLALPGVCLPVEQVEASQITELIFPNVPYRIVDDTWAGLFCETCEENGICAFSGAGASVSVALGTFRTEKIYKIDGWGPLIGDFGSAFQLMIDFFRLLGRGLDNGIESILFTELQEYCDEHQLLPIDSIPKVQRWFDDFLREYGADWRSQFAKLAVPIMRAADRDDNSAASIEAQHLVGLTAAAIVESINIALAREPIRTRDLPIVLQGGMFRYGTFFTREVIRLIDVDLHRIKPARLRPVDGALMLAGSQFGIEKTLQASLLAQEATHFLDYQ